MNCYPASRDCQVLTVNFPTPPLVRQETTCRFSRQASPSLTPITHGAELQSVVTPTPTCSSPSEPQAMRSPRSHGPKKCAVNAPLASVVSSSHSRPTRIQESGAEPPKKSAASCAGLRSPATRPASPADFAHRYFVRHCRGVMNASRLHAFERHAQINHRASPMTALGNSGSNKVCVEARPHRE